MSYLYKEVINLPNVTENNPNQTVIPFSQGRLERIDIDFPDGCVRLCRCKIFLHGTQIIPFNLDSSIGYNDFILQIPCSIDIIQPPYEIIIHTWNLDTTFTHTLGFGFVYSYNIDTGNPIINDAIPITISEDA